MIVYYLSWNDSISWFFVNCSCTRISIRNFIDIFLGDDDDEPTLTIDLPMLPACANTTDSKMDKDVHSISQSSWEREITMIANTIHNAATTAYGKMRRTMQPVVDDITARSEKIRLNRGHPHSLCWTHSVSTDKRKKPFLPLSLSLSFYSITSIVYSLYYSMISFYYFKLIYLFIFLIDDIMTFHSKKRTLSFIWNCWIICAIEI